MIVRDWQEREIKVGTKGMYGAPAEGESLDNYLCEVTEIGEPDCDEAIGCYLYITLKFADGEEIKIRCVMVGPRWYDEDEVYEEGGDFEVTPDDEEEVTVNA